MSADIVILDDGVEIRDAFIRKFTMTWEEFRIAKREWLDFLAQKNYKLEYHALYLWDKMPDYPTVSFARAIDLLRSMGGDVYFMSENESYPEYASITVDGVEHKGCVAKSNAAALADLIEFEWYEEWRLAARNMYLANTVLPEDLYVFDGAMEHMLVFTHENDHWDLEIEQPMVAAASRYCMAYGFESEDERTDKR